MNNLNAASLIKAGRAVPEPFELTVLRDGGTLSRITVLKILRLLPARRIVAVAEDESGQLLIKLFIGRSAARYTRREIRGVKAIESVGAKTPGLRWHGTLDSGDGEVVAFDYLGGADDLIDVWQESSDEERHQLMKSVASELARLHENGVIQNDIHTENFLIYSGCIYTIDGGDVSHAWSKQLGQRKSLQNLALFLAQFHAGNDASIPEVLSLYQEARGWRPSLRRQEDLYRMVRTKRNQRKNNLIKKAFRECTRFSCRSGFRRFTVCERKYDSRQMQSLLADPDSAMAEGTLLKDGNTTTVAVVSGPSGRLVIKRYNIKSFGHRLTRMFRRSRASASWANTLRLEFLGIRTLKPVALVEERFGPLRGRAWFITEYLEGRDGSTLNEAGEQEEAMRSMVEILKSLTEAGVTHGDLKASNFLLTSEGAVIIDLDSMAEHDRGDSGHEAQARDLERFMRNWTGAPELEKRFADLLQ